MVALAYHVISKKVENQIFRSNWFFRHTCMYEQPMLKKYRIITFLCQYYIIISDTLVGSFLDGVFLLLDVILLDLHEKLRKNKDWVTEISTETNWYEEHHFLDWAPSFLCMVLLLSSSTPFPFPWTY